MNIAVPPIAIDEALGTIVLALADDEFVVGHRHSEWLGLSPFLEEDLAMASIAQDELGHARALYALLWPEWTEREASLPLRAPSAWRCCELVEFDAKPWERHLVRHVLYDVTERHRWQALVDADLAALAAVAARALQEERWHERHATDLLRRLAPTEAAKLQPHLNDLWPMVSALTDGLRPAEAKTAIDDLSIVLASASLTVPQIDPVRELRPDRTKRTAAFVEVHESLTEVSLVDPHASW